MPRRRILFFVTGVTVLGALVRLGMHHPYSPSRTAASAARPQAPSVPVDGEGWIDRYDPASASAGYTLDLYRARLPILFDMNGRIVHSWPTVRATARVRLTAQGRLLAICADDVVREYDADGREVWSFPPPRGKDFPHHDVMPLRNGNTLLLFRDSESATDYLLEVDHEGRVVWEWRSLLHLGARLDLATESHDRTHVNSIEELPENPLHDAGDLRFRPGNILLSVRNINTVLVVARETGDVVWEWRETLDLQHEARMIPRGHPGAGHVVLFNNRPRDPTRRSVVVEIDPAAGRIVRQTAPPYMFSKVGGIVQPLDNGNLLVASSGGGRIFEVDAAGNVPWQCILPYHPMRPVRYPYAFAKPLLGPRRAEERTVRSRLTRPFVDRSLYALNPRHDGRLDWTPHEGEEERPLTRATCWPVVVPPAATLRLGYGVRRRAPNAPERDRRKFHFDVRLSLEGAPPTNLPIVDEDLAAASGSVRHDCALSLEPYAYREATVCVDARHVNSTNRQMPGRVFWDGPAIVLASQAAPAESLRPRSPLSEAEKERLEEHLKAMGYVE